MVWWAVLRRSGRQPTADIENGGAVKRKNKLDNYRPGYPRYTALMATHDPFLIARRFRQIRARLLLLKQDKLVQLESRLDKLDAEEESPVFLGKSRLDQNTERIEVLGEMDEKLADYDEFLQRSNKVLSLGGAHKRDITSLVRWLEGNGCIAREEARYLQNDQDLLSLAHEPDDALTKLESWVEDQLLLWNPSSLLKLSRELSDDPNVIVNTADRTRRIAKCIILIVMAMLLLLPILICNLEALAQNFTGRMFVVVGFVILYLVIILAMSRARTLEVLLAGATYATVLIVFVSNSTN
ncbi:hypothetical protein QBC39DRAFT_358313 [Podospora conica]|nr:hypothetical protein QBC39DRAFT_358313 [Schizothecium conicum]